MKIWFWQSEVFHGPFKLTKASDWPKNGSNLFMMDNLPFLITDVTLESSIDDTCQAD